MLNIAGIDHIVLRTTRLNEMLHFYCCVLGCTLERQTSDEIGITQLRAGNSLIDLINVNSKLGKSGGGPPGTTGNNLDHFCLQLESIADDDIRAHLKAHHITVGDFSERYGAQGMGKSVYIKDPEGNTVELRSRIE